MADVEHQPRSSAEEPSPLYRLFASPEYFFSMCERHVFSRVNPTTIKFLTHTSREERKRAENTREGTEEVSFGRVRVEGGDEGAHRGGEVVGARTGDRGRWRRRRDKEKRRRDER